MPVKCTPFSEPRLMPLPSGFHWLPSHVATLVAIPVGVGIKKLPATNTFPFVATAMLVTYAKGLMFIPGVELGVSRISVTPSPRVPQLVPSQVAMLYDHGRLVRVKAVALVG